MIETLASFFERELLKLREEILLFTDEKKLWAVTGLITNSAGNLCLHLTGNLNHFIGATLGNSGYIRQRDREFSDKNIPRAQLIADIDKTIVLVKNTLHSLEPGALEEVFPLDKHGQTVTTGYMVLHLLTHLNYHLGQVNYLRRTIDN